MVKKEVTMLKLINLNHGLIVAEQVKVAKTFWQRLRGLMFTDSLPAGCALHLTPCRSIHTYYMNYSIDILHLNSNHQVIAIQEQLTPGKWGQRIPQTASIVELPAGTIRQTGIKPGHVLNFVKKPQKGEDYYVEEA
jgi:uncharacterized membrane protein (UPF0127 family)